jgi:hypothetical protein
MEKMTGTWALVRTEAVDANDKPQTEKPENTRAMQGLILLMVVLS